MNVAVNFDVCVSLGFLWRYFLGWNMMEWGCLYRYIPR